jgi:hypothetical protein
MEPEQPDIVEKLLLKLAPARRSNDDPGARPVEPTPQRPPGTSIVLVFPDPLAATSAVG